MKKKDYMREWNKKHPGYHKHKRKVVCLVKGKDNRCYWRIDCIVKYDGLISNSGYVWINEGEWKNEKTYYNWRKTDGMCLFCGELDFSVLEKHHIDKEKMPDFTITLCGNCHNKLHWFLGVEWKHA